MPNYNEFDLEENFSNDDTSPNRAGKVSGAVSSAVVTSVLTGCTPDCTNYCTKGCTTTCGPAPVSTSACHSYCGGARTC